MNIWLMGVVLTLTALAMAGMAVLLLKDEVAGDVMFGFLALIELVLVVQLVVGAVALSGTGRDVSGVLFVSYLVGILLALPIGAAWSLVERSRFGTGVLLVAALTVVALEVRLDAIWAGAGA